MPINDESSLRAIGGILMTLFSGVMAWLHVRLNRLDDNKVSKEVFKEFKEGNEREHKQQQRTLDKIFDKLDGKQDRL